MTPMVSVVIPTFNRAQEVPKAIESVLAQTYIDYELIVVDDGSVDGTGEVLQPFENRIQYLYQDNRGAAAAQNAGIRRARGHWVAILGSDDARLKSGATNIAELDRLADRVNLSSHRCQV